MERGGNRYAAFQAGSVTINFRMGHLDTMPCCAVCGRALCGHSDAEFAGKNLTGPSPDPGRQGAVRRESTAPHFQWLASIPGVPADWPAVSIPPHSNSTSPKGHHDHVCR